MSNLSRFDPDFTAGQQRFHVNSTNTITGYLKCDGSVVSQATYPGLYAQIGLIPDGVTANTWTLRSVASTLLSSVAYGNSTFLAMSGTLGYTSTDGVSWGFSVTGATTTLNTVTYGNNLFAAAGDINRVYTTTDGVTWTTRSAGVPLAYWRSVSYNSSLYVMVGDGGPTSYTPSYIVTSSDAITWTQRTPADAVNGLNRVAYLNNLWITCGRNGSLATSTDAITWTARSSNYYLAQGSTYDIRDVIYANGLYIAYGTLGYAVYSTDAITWTQRTTNIDQFYAVKYYGGTYLAARGTGSSSENVYYSYDGFTWVLTSGNGLSYAFDLTLGGSTLVVVGQTAGGGPVLYNTAYTYTATTSFKLPSTSASVIRANITTPTAYIKAK